MSEAFNSAHDKFSREYAFGDWKSIDWSGLYTRLSPRIAQAQATGGERVYYLALKEYVCSVPDGHIGLQADNPDVPLTIGQELAGGGFGMAVAEIDDGRVIAAVVTPNGPADAAGIVPGAEIVTWGGIPAREAIGQIDACAVPFQLLAGAGVESPRATAERYRLDQAMLLTRGPIGASVAVVFRNPGSALSSTNLTAVDDGGQTLFLLNFAKDADYTQPAIEYRILPEGYGYLLVRMMADLASPGGYPTAVLENFREAIQAFVAAGVPGVIIDVRGNIGGSDQLAADMCGFFYQEPSFYEYQEYYDKRNGRFLPYTLNEHDFDRPVDNISITPQIPYYGGPVVALVNRATHSSGEGLPMCVARLPQGRVIGFSGTDGSFGMEGNSIRMPGGYMIAYPVGRSLDSNYVIQLDSRGGEGGVAPDIRVPKTYENVMSYAAGTDMELEYAILFFSVLRAVDQVRRMLEEDLGVEVPALNVLIEDPRRRIFVSSVPDGQSPYTEDTFFRFASITKNFTATAILKMHQDGWLDYQARIVDNIPGSNLPYVPDTDEWNIPYKDAITIKKLLQHTAGVYDVDNDPVPGFEGKSYTEYMMDLDLGHQFTTDEMVEQLSEKNLFYFEPGEGYQYSNTGYSILSKIIARVYSYKDGNPKTYGDYLHEHITGGQSPVSLTAHFPVLAGDVELPEPNIPGNIIFDGETQQFLELNVSDLVGQGNGYATYADLNRYIRSLMRGENVLSPESVQRMQTDVSTHMPTYALGSEYRENLGFGHTGARIGNLSLMAYDPEYEVSVVVHLNLWDLRRGLDSLMLSARSTDYATWAAREALGYPGAPTQQ